MCWAVVHGGSPCACTSLLSQMINGCTCQTGGVIFVSWLGQKAFGLVKVPIRWAWASEPVGLERKAGTMQQRSVDTKMMAMKEAGQQGYPEVALRLLRGDVRAYARTARPAPSYTPAPSCTPALSCSRSRATTMVHRSCSRHSDGPSSWSGSGHPHRVPARPDRPARRSGPVRTGSFVKPRLGRVPWIMGLGRVARC